MFAVQRRAEEELQKELKDAEYTDQEFQDFKKKEHPWPPESSEAPLLTTCSLQIRSIFPNYI